MTCAVIPSKLFHVVVAAVLLGMYVYYMKLKFSAEDEEGEGCLSLIHIFVGSRCLKKKRSDLPAMRSVSANRS